MSELERLHWTELRGRVRGLVGTARAAEVVVRAEQAVDVAEIYAPTKYAIYHDGSSSTTVSRVNAPLAYAPYEDAVFSDEEDGGEESGAHILGEDQGVEPSRWPHVSSEDMLDAESLIDNTLIPAEAVMATLDVIEAWSLCD